MSWHICRILMPASDIRLLHTTISNIQIDTKEPSSVHIGVELQHVAVPLHLSLVAVDTTVSLNKGILHTNARNNIQPDYDQFHPSLLIKSESQKLWLRCEAMAVTTRSCKIKLELYTIATWQVKGRRYLSRNLDASRWPAWRFAVLMCWFMSLLHLNLSCKIFHNYISINWFL